RVTPNGPRNDVNVALSAMPVTMPGSVIGSTRRKLIERRPKNRYRCTANAAIAPSTSAMAVAQSPATTEVPSADIAPLLAAAERHQRRVNAVGGKPNVREALNEFSTTSASGR